jgi:hypothetical protein
VVPVLSWYFIIRRTCFTHKTYLSYPRTTCSSHRALSALAYIILYYHYMCMCTFYLDTLPKGRWINPRARVLRNPPYITRTSDGRRHFGPPHHLWKNFSPTNRNRQARDVPADCERGSSKIIHVYGTQTSRRPSAIPPTTILYYILYSSVSGILEPWVGI